MALNLSLALIVANNEDDIERANRAIDSVKDFVDEVCVLQNGKGKQLKGLEQYNTEFFQTPDDWNLNFSELRTKNFAQCKGRYILWMDADDVFEGAENLPKLITQADAQQLDGFAFQYFYEKDSSGQWSQIHWKMQLLKNDDHFKWAGAIHEDPIQQRQARWYQTYDVKRIHDTTAERGEASQLRNIVVLEREHEQNPKEPRNLFYLGRAYIATKQYEKAVGALHKYLTLSGWDDERYEARILLGSIAMEQKNYPEAIEAFHEAILEKESNPDAYIQKGMAYLRTGEYQKALKNLQISTQFDPPEQATYYNPMLYTRDVCAASAICFLNLGKLNNAKRAIQQARSYDSKSLYLAELNQLINEMDSKNNLAEHYFQIMQYLKDESPDLLAPLLASVPKLISDDPRILAGEFAVQKPQEWADNSIAIYCGNTIETFTAKDVNGKGLGGSETAVIELSKRLVKKGWEVTVFNRCDAPPEGITEDGITFKNFWQINKKDHFNVLWLWRTPQLLDIEWNTQKIIVDLHDVVSPMEWTPERIEKVDKVFVKSEYHKSLYSKIPDEKFVVVGNGIDLSRFTGKVEKNPNRFVYASTPDRGLDVLLEHIWPRIKESIPEAELHLYYGWKTFYELERSNPERMAWMKKVQALAEQDGVVNHGRVGQKELAQDLLKTSYWLYPTDFPEIHCITACEMQAAGVFPITTGFAALQETQKVGVKLDGDIHDPEWQKDYIEEVLIAYQDSYDPQEIQKVADQFSWDLVTDVWDTELRSSGKE